MNQTLHLLWVWGGFIGLALCTIAALFRGGPPEKWGAAILIASFVATPLLDDHTPFQWTLVGVDVIILLAFMLLSVSARKIWIYVATASQGICVVVHLMALTAPKIMTWAYYTAMGFWGGWAPLIALAFGIALARRRTDRVP